MKYVHCFTHLPLVLIFENLNPVKFYVGILYATQEDFKDHMGVIIMMGKGTVVIISKKHMLEKRSSTETKLFILNDVMPQVFC